MCQLWGSHQQPPGATTTTRDRAGEKGWPSKLTATLCPLTEPSSWPWLPLKPSSLAAQPGRVFPCFHLPKLLLLGYTRGYGVASTKYMPAHPRAPAIGLSRHREARQGEDHQLLQLQAWPETPDHGHKPPGKGGRHGNQSEKARGAPTPHLSPT